MSEFCLNYNCDEIIDHAPVDCEAYLNGGNSDIILLECGHGITDASNASQVQAALDAGTAKLVQNVTIDIPNRSAQKGDNPVACRPQRIINYDNTFNFLDANVTNNNIEFYETSLGGHTFAGAIIHECDSDKVTFIDDNIVMEGGLINPKTNKELQRFEGVGSWTSKKIPRKYAIPVGIF